MPDPFTVFRNDGSTDTVPGRRRIPPPTGTPPLLPDTPPVAPPPISPLVPSTWGTGENPYTQDQFTQDTANAGWAGAGDDASSWTPEQFQAALSYLNGLGADERQTAARWDPRLQTALDLYRDTAQGHLHDQAYANWAAPFAGAGGPNNATMTDQQRAENPGLLLDAPGTTDWASLFGEAQTGYADAERTAHPTLNQWGQKVDEQGNVLASELPQPSGYNDANGVFRTFGNDAQGFAVRPDSQTPDTPWGGNTPGHVQAPQNPFRSLSGGWEQGSTVYGPNGQVIADRNRSDPFSSFNTWRAPNNPGSAGQYGNKAATTQQYATGQRPWWG